MAKLLKAHFRRGKAGLFVVTIFMTLAVFLFTVGLTFIIKVPNLFKEKLVEIDSSDIMFNLTVPKSISFQGSTLDVDFSKNLIEEVYNLDYIEKTSYSEYAFLQNATLFKTSGNTTISQPSFLNKDADIEMKPIFTKEIDGEGIPLYFSAHMKYQNFLRAGETFTLVLSDSDREIPCYIAGFFESVQYLYFNYSLIYTDAANYEMFYRIQSEDPLQKYLIKSINVKFNQEYDFNLRSRFISDFGEIYSNCRNSKIEELKSQFSPIPIPESILSNVSIGYGFKGIEETISASEPYMLLLSVMLIVFSLVMTVIALIIINFLIRSGIEDDMRNLGVLKGLGYTTRQLRASYLILYGILVGIGAILGMIIALATAPVFDKILILLSSIPFTIPPNGYAAVGSVLIALAVSLSAVWLITGKLKKVTPLYALRGAFTSRRFKKNSIPLEKSKIGINATIGLKTIVQNKRQSIMSFIILTVMTLLCAFSFTMFYNMNVDRSAMVQLAGQENYDIGVEVELPKDMATKENFNAIFDKIKDFPEVNRMLNPIYDRMLGWINGEINVSFRTAKDYSVYNVDIVYEGRNPISATECVVSGDIRKALNVKIGDVLKLSLAQGDTDETIEKDFTVVGFSQGLYNNRTISTTEEGYWSISTTDSFGSYDYRYVYLKDEYKNGSNFDVFKNDLSTRINAIIGEVFPELLAEEYKIYLSNRQAQLDDLVFKIVAPASSLLMNIIYVVTAIVVASVVFMIIRMKMIREKKNIAISKAVGYTSFQIMHQTGLSMLLIALPAALIGGILGGVLVNPFMNLIGGLIGLYKVSFGVNFGFIVLISVILGVLNYIVTLLVSLSTRLVTPRMLVR